MPDEPIVPTADFVMEVSAIAATEATVTVTPADEEITYYFGVLTKEFYGTFADDAAFMADDLAFLSSTAEMMGMTLLEFLASGFVLSSGVDEYTFTNLKGSTDYVAYAYGMDVNAQFTTELYTSSFSTPEWIASDDATFTVETSNIKTKSFEYTVTPSNNTTRYYCGVTRKEYADSEYADNPNGLVQEFIEIAEAYGVDWTANEDVYTGEQQLSSAGYNINAETEYYIAVFGVNTSGEQTTELSLTPVTTAAPTASQNTFDVTVLSTTSESIFVDIVASNDDTYFFGLDTAVNLEGMDDNQIMAKFLADAGGGLAWFLVSGSQMNYELMALEPETEYILGVFGCEVGPDDQGVITTELTKLSMSTTSSSSPAPMRSSAYLEMPSGSNQTRVARQ